MLVQRVVAFTFYIHEFQVEMLVQQFFQIIGTTAVQAKVENVSG